VAHWGRPGTGFPLPLPRRAVLAFTRWVEGVRCRMGDVSRVRGGGVAWEARGGGGHGRATPPPGSSLLPATPGLYITPPFPWPPIYLPFSDHLLGPPPWDPSQPSRITNFGLGDFFVFFFFSFVQRNILFKSVF